MLKELYFSFTGSGQVRTTCKKMESGCSWSDFLWNTKEKYCTCIGHVNWLLLLWEPRERSLVYGNLADQVTFEKKKNLWSLTDISCQIWLYHMSTIIFFYIVLLILTKSPCVMYACTNKNTGAQIRTHGFLLNPCRQKTRFLAHIRISFWENVVCYKNTYTEVF